MAQEPEQTPASRAKNALWQPGQSGNPAGRPKGSRSKLAEMFWTDLHEAWQSRGKDAIVKMIEEKPGDFVKVVASQMPKEWIVKAAELEDVSDEELADVIQSLRQISGAARLKKPKKPDAPRSLDS